MTLNVCVLPVLGIFPSMLGALKDAVESITKIYEELQKYKAMVQAKLDAVKAKIDELKETAQYDKVKQFMEDNQKILGWAQKAAIVFGPHIANAAVAKVSSRMDADTKRLSSTNMKCSSKKSKTMRRRRRRRCPGSLSS